MRQIGLLLVLLTALSGCAQVISEQGRRLVDPAVTFGKLKQHPDEFIGKYVVLGGIVAAARNAKEGGELEVVQVPLDSDDIPLNTLSTGGRFLATSSQFLDAMIYKPGRLVTILGEVKGKQVRPLDEVDYTYPVVAIREIHVWKSPEAEKGFPYPAPGPFYNYEPYYYGYGVGPYWFRPYGPPVYP